MDQVRCSPGRGAWDGHSPREEPGEGRCHQKNTGRFPTSPLLPPPTFRLQGNNWIAAQISEEEEHPKVRGRTPRTCESSGTSSHRQQGPQPRPEPPKRAKACEPLELLLTHRLRLSPTMTRAPGRAEGKRVRLQRGSIHGHGLSHVPFPAHHANIYDQYVPCSDGKSRSTCGNGRAVTVECRGNARNQKLNRNAEYY